jgi:hypothetical protein
LKSFFSSEWLITCFVPTLFAGRRNAAYPTPPRAIARAMQATTKAGDGRSQQDFHLFDLLLGLP